MMGFLCFSEGVHFTVAAVGQPTQEGCVLQRKEEELMRYIWHYTHNLENADYNTVVVFVLNLEVKSIIWNQDEWS